MKRFPRDSDEYSVYDGLSYNPRLIVDRGVIVSLFYQYFCNRYISIVTFIDAVTLMDRALSTFESDEIYLIASACLMIIEKKNEDNYYSFYKMLEKAFHLDEKEIKRMEMRIVCSCPIEHLSLFQWVKSYPEVENLSKKSGKMMAYFSYLVLYKYSISNFNMHSVLAMCIVQCSIFYLYFDVDYEKMSYFDGNPEEIASIVNQVLLEAGMI